MISRRFDAKQPALWLAVVSLALLALASAAPAQEAAEKPGVETHTVRLLGSSFQVLESGRGNDLTVLLLHGARYSAETWRRLGTLHLLAKQGFHALALDLPGYGGSEPSKIADHDLLAQLLPLLIDRPVVVVSPSMSGRFSLPLIERRASWVAGFVPIAPAGIDVHAEKLAGSSVPTLIFWGAKDRVVPLKKAKVLTKMFTDSRTVVLEGASHPCYLDAPIEFHRELLRFLEGLRAER